MAKKYNTQNLLRKEDRTASERRESARKAGIASGKARRAKSVKTFKQMLVEGLTEAEQKQMLEALKESAEQGSLPHLEFLLKMAGQHPDQEPPTDNAIRITIEGADDYGD